MSHIFRFFVRVFRRISRYVKLKRKMRFVDLKRTGLSGNSSNCYSHYDDQELTDQERRG